MHNSGCYVLAAAAALVIAGCEPPASTSSDAEPAPTIAELREEGIVMAMQIQSPSFANNETVPKQFTGDGKDVSPKLTWAGVPDTAKELALICDDPDAPTPQPWVHWVIYKIPPSASGLPENVAKTDKPPEPAGALQGKNSWGRIGYGGPAPPRGHGVHHYHFKLHALDAALNVTPGLDKNQLLKAMKGHVIGEGELVGTYQR